MSTNYGSNSITRVATAATGALLLSTLSVIAAVAPAEASGVATIVYASAEMRTHG